MDDPDKLQLPSAPPDRVRGAIETLFAEWNSIQEERQQWQLERAQLRAKILQLEADARTHQQVRMDLIRRLKLLEHGLLSERENFMRGGPQSSFAQNTLRRLPTVRHLEDGKRKTLPRNFLSSADAADNSPGRMFLREYLIELGYLKEAAQLDGFNSRHEFEAVVSGELKNRPKPVETDQKTDINSNDWKAGNSPPMAGVAVSNSGSFAKPKGQSSHRRRGSVDGLLLDTKISSEVKRWKASVSLRSHLDSVRCLEFHPQAAQLLSGSEDGTVRLWNVEHVLDASKKPKKNHEPSYTFRGHEGMITSVAYKTDRDLCLSAGVDGIAHVWGLPDLKHDPYDDEGRCLSFHKAALEGHTDAIWSIASVQASSVVLTAASDGKVALWNIDSSDPTNINNHMQSSITYTTADGDSHAIPTCVSAMNSDPKKVIIGYMCGTLVQADIETGQIIRAIASKTDSDKAPHITAMASHPTLSLAVTAHADNNVRIFDVQQGACVSVVQTHRDAVTGISIDPSGLYFASCSHDQSVRFWDFTNKNIIQDVDGYQTHRKKYDEAIHCVSYHPSLPIVASGGADSIVKLYL